MSDRSDDAVVIERRGGSGIGLFLLGAALGAGIALLFAPQSGEETRADIRRVARKAKRKARDLGESGRELAEELMETGRDAVDDLAETGRSALRSAKRTGRNATRDARAALEERLARHREAEDGEEDGV
jgi:gas vesicle protein